jgi:hypothetical protein
LFWWVSFPPLLVVVEFLVTKQAESVEDLKRLLSVLAGGVVCTTVQKFQPGAGGSYPLLSEPLQHAVIADEARSLRCYTWSSAGDQMVSCFKNSFAGILEASSLKHGNRWVTPTWPSRRWGCRRPYM